MTQTRYAAALDLLLAAMFVAFIAANACGVFA